MSNRGNTNVATEHKIHYKATKHKITLLKIHSGGLQTIERLSRNDITMKEGCPILPLPYIIMSEIFISGRCYCPVPLPWPIVTHALVYAHPTTTITDSKASKSEALTHNSISNPSRSICFECVLKGKSVRLHLCIHQNKRFLQHRQEIRGGNEMGWQTDWSRYIIQALC